MRSPKQATKRTTTVRWFRIGMKPAPAETKTQQQARKRALDAAAGSRKAKTPSTLPNGRVARRKAATKQQSAKLVSVNINWSAIGRRLIPELEPETALMLWVAAGAFGLGMLLATLIWIAKG